MSYVLTFFAGFPLLVWEVVIGSLVLFLANSVGGNIVGWFGI